MGRFTKLNWLQTCKRLCLSISLSANLLLNSMSMCCELMYENRLPNFAIQNTWHPDVNVRPPDDTIFHSGLSPSLVARFVFVFIFITLAGYRIVWNDRTKPHRAAPNNLLTTRDILTILICDILQRVDVVLNRLRRPRLLLTGELTFEHNIRMRLPLPSPRFFVDSR